MSYSRGSVLAMCVAVACGQRGEEVAPVVAAPVVVAPPTETPKPEPASEPARPRGRSGMKVADDAPRFVVVARTQGEGDSRVVTLLEGTDGSAFLAAGPLLLRLLGDGAVESEPAWVRGIGDSAGDLDAFEAGMYWWNAAAIGGSWPEPAYLVLEQLSASRAGGSPPDLYRRTGGVWTRVETQKERLAWYPRSFGPWKDGSLLALKGFQPTYPADVETEPSRAEVRAYEAALKREKRLIVLRGEPKAPKFGERDIVAFASLASGQIWALLEDGGRPAVLYFDGASETVTALPGSERGKLSELGLRATAADRAWAFGMRATDDAVSGYLARFDGTAWTEVESGCAGMVQSLSIDADGDAYYTCPVKGVEGAVLLRLRGGVIEELPTEVEPWTVVARRADDIWVLSPPHSGAAQLLHSGSTRAQPFEVPGSLEVARSVFEWAEPVPALCNRMWIPLAPGSDRAAVERTVAGVVGDSYEVEVVEARVQGRVEAGVMVRTYGGTHERMIFSLLKKLGGAVGEPTCNQRPAVAGPG